MEIREIRPRAKILPSHVFLHFCFCRDHCLVFPIVLRATFFELSEPPIVVTRTSRCNKSPGRRFLSDATQKAPPNILTFEDFCPILVGPNQMFL
jgi:hypothetical protein